MLPQPGHTTSSYSPPPPSAQFPSAPADHNPGSSSLQNPRKASASPPQDSSQSAPRTPSNQSQINNKASLLPQVSATAADSRFTGPRPESLLAPSAPSLPQPYHESPSQPLAAGSLSSADSSYHHQAVCPTGPKQSASMLEPDHREIRLTRTGRISKALKGQAVHRCEQCGKVYTRLEHLRRHQRNHGTILRCDIDGCDKVFHRHDMLERHRENGHKVLPNRKRIVPRPSDELPQQPHYPYPQPTNDHPESAAYTPHMTAPTSTSSATSESQTQSSTAAPSNSQPSQRPQLTLSTVPAAHRLPSIQSLLNDEVPISPVLPPPTGAFKSPMSAQPFAGSAPTSPAGLEHPQSAFPSPGPYFTAQTGPTPTSARRPYQYPPPPPPPTHQSSHSPENSNAKVSTPKSQYPPHPAPRPNAWQGHHASRSLHEISGQKHAASTTSPPAKRQRLSEERKVNSSPPQPLAHDDSHVNDVMARMSRRWAPQPAASH